MLVVLWGAVVRATSSGAGCGAHWPLCDGVVVPMAKNTQIVIEFAHRATSGMALVLVIALAVWAVRLFPSDYRARKAAIAAVIGMVVESLFGAALVLFGWTDQNKSIERTFMIALHQVNTLILLGSITLTWWWSREDVNARAKNAPAPGWVKPALLVSFIGLLFIGASGAVTALGDTLFPSNTLAEGLKQDFAAASHFLIQLRVYHPFIAIAVGAFMVVIGRLVARVRGDEFTTSLGKLLMLLTFGQWVLGLFNVGLLAPVPVQILHLLLADCVWITFVLLASQALVGPIRVAQAVNQSAKKAATV